MSFQSVQTLALKRIPGEVGRAKKHPNDALESRSGVCLEARREGGPHYWKLGRCTQYVPVLLLRYRLHNICEVCNLALRLGCQLAYTGVGCAQAHTWLTGHA